MINVKFYSFSKKENSTKVPTSPVVPSAEYSCLLKDGSGVISPELEIATSANVSSWNYCYISDFGRYYFVSEWTYDNGQWIAKLTIDVLASWKTNIGSSTQYVTRSSYTYDPYVTDTFYPVKTVADIRRSTFSATGAVQALDTTMLGSGANFMVGIINNDNTNSAGAVTQYVMTPAQLDVMKRLLMTDNGWIGNVDPGASPVDIAKSQVDINPFQYITQCRWFPVPVPIIGDTPFNNIRFGWWQTTISAYKFYGYSPVYQWKLDPTPQHSYADTRGKYLNSKGFASHFIDFAGFHFDLDANMVAQTNKLYVELRIDFISGQACCWVKGEEEGGLTTYNIAEEIQNLSVNVPLAAISFAGDGWSGVPVVGGLLSSVAQGANAVAGSMYGSHSSQGLITEHAIAANLGLNKIESSFMAGSGGLAGIASHPVPVLTSVFQFTADEDNASAGRPLCKNKTISSIPGFIKCNHVEIELPATEQEIVSIKNYMEGGFFYE